MEFNASEADRIAALVNFGILDSESEAPFDRLTRSVATLFSVPMAAVSLIDVNRQWFKSSVGLSVCETPREFAFCDHTMRKAQNAVMVVPDPTSDQRFKDNPLVTDEPKIRFYAGAPLITREGLGLGALCIIDTKPRPDLNDQTLHPLVVYAQRCMWLLEKRRQARLHPNPRKQRQAEAGHNQIPNPWSASTHTHRA